MNAFRSASPAQHQEPVAADALSAHLSSGTAESLRASVNALDDDDMTALLERLDPRQSSGNDVRQRIVTRRRQAS